MPAWDAVRSAFPLHFQGRIGAAVSDALRSTTLVVDEVEVTLDLRGGWFADILLSGGGRLESVVTRLRPAPAPAA